MARDRLKEPSTGRWVKSLCLSTVAWIMMSIGLVAGFVAEEGVNHLVLETGSSGDISDIQAIREIESTLGIMLAPGGSAIKSITAIWILGWFGVFALDQLILKRLRNGKTSCHGKA